MVRIRLRRMGLKGQPVYRIVVSDSREARNGAVIETIGHFNPRTQPSTDVVKEDRALYWLSVGAQPTDSVRRILNRTGTLGRFDRLRKGETIETLAAEAAANAVPLPSPRTQYPSPEAGQSRLKKAEG